MFFTISRLLFEEENIDCAHLNMIWHACIENHRFYQSDIDDVYATESSIWYSNLSDIDKKLWEESVAYSVQMGDKYSKVKVSIGSSHTPFEAWHYLNSNLSIILENSRNDSHFLNALFRCFRSESKPILKKIENRYIEFVLGGGSSIQHVIQTKLESFNSPKFTKDAKNYLRYFVVLDSDKEYPLQPLKSDKVNLLSFLDSNNVPYHVLEKREMENYLPEIVFTHITHHNEFIEAYLRLTPEQKDYFDIENGFKDINFSSLPQEIQTFYQSVGEADKNTFRKCDMKKFTGSDREDFKSEFPKLFNSASVDKLSLLSRTDHQRDRNELIKIINKIKELL